MGCVYVSEDMATTAELTRIVDKLVERVDNHIKFFWAVIAAGLLSIGALWLQLNQIKSDIGKLGRPLKLAESAMSPNDQKSQEDAKAIIKSAKKTSTPLPLPLVEQSGKSFIEAATNNAGAWDVALYLVAYRSSLNAAYRPTDRMGPLPRDKAWQFSAGQVPGKPLSTMLFTQFGPPEKEAARFDHIGVDRNSSLPFGPAWLFVVGSADQLDDFHIRNVVFESVEVHYYGGPLILENVIFINCTFVMDNVPPVRLLGEQMLISGTVNFKNLA